MSHNNFLQRFSLLPAIIQIFCQGEVDANKFSENLKKTLTKSEKFVYYKAVPLKNSFVSYRNLTSFRLFRATIAQLVEHLTCNEGVAGSIPAGGSWKKSKSKRQTARGSFCCLHFAFSYGEVPERPNGADCKSAGSAFGGSNPSLSTRIKQKAESKKKKAKSKRQKAKKLCRLQNRVLAHVAQSVEHFLGKEEVIGSIPIVSSS